MLPIIDAMTERGVRRLLGGVVTAVAAVSLMTGCSGDESEAPEVATLASAAAPAASAPAAADDQRPLIRLDATDEERTRMYQAWSDCLVKEGGPEYEGQQVLKGEMPKGPNVKAVVAACVTKHPEEFQARFERQDPTGFKDANRRFYKCAQGKGYKLTAPDPENGRFGLTEIGPQGDWGSAGIRECEREAYAGR